MSGAIRLPQRSARAWVSIAFAVIALISALLIAASFAAAAHRSSATADPTQQPIFDKDGFPCVDWAYWHSVNPDIIGWISIPGTRISSPLVQAPANDPTFYLEHDAYREANYHGCPYLDAECARIGLNSQNAVVFGHNIAAGMPMFADLARYTDEAFFWSHQNIFVQTPTWKRILSVAGVAVTPGDAPTKRTSFLDGEDFRNWFLQRLSECVIRNDLPASPSACLTLVTCQSATDDAKRVLVYATLPERNDAAQARASASTSSS